MRRLAISWKAGPHTALGTEAIYRGLEDALQQAGAVARRRGDPERELSRARTIITARYRTAYLAHCTPEPMNCIADVRAGACDVWVGTQNQTETQAMAAALTGLPKRKVNVHTTFLGGGLGRRLATDFVAEAVRLSMHFGRPVQVLWTRSDDLQHDRFRPAHAVALRAALDGAGMPSVWWQRLAGPRSALQMNDVLYTVGNLCEEHVEVDSVLPIGAWRGVGATQNAFVVESFIDELAHAAGRDPFEYRLALLENAHHANVLQKAADAVNWHGPAPSGWHRGIALYESFGSCVAQVAEVSTDGSKVRVHRFVCVIDCGQPVNPDGIRAQLEGSVALGLSAALKEEVRVEGGRVVQTGFADYPILTFSEMPVVEVHIVGSSEAPGGLGEPGVPVVAPALGNAIFAATGRRLRTLPLRLS